MFMNPHDLLLNKAEILKELLSVVSSKHGITFNECAKEITNALRNGNTIFWCGNGGSAAESSHLAVELIGRFKNNRRALPSLSLNADTSAITCIANDFGYDEIFARQLEGLGKKGDVLIVLSSSGKSKNILRALQKSKEKGITSIALLGKKGGQAIALADFAIVIDSDETARIQECHIMVGHIICGLVEAQLFAPRA
jgi:D-sedoheptulose 7-phosphate isomerase